MHQRRAETPFYIPSLDGIRALSFSIVFTAHAGLAKYVPGYFGLSLFFFLSGFLITTLLRKEVDLSGHVSFRDFYLRRVLRIFPPFYLVLVVAYALTLLGVLGNTLTRTAVLYQLLHLSNYYVVEHGWWEGLAPGTWVYWSLAVEEHFYLVFPLLYATLRKRGYSASRQVAVLLAICLACLLWRFVLVYGFHASKERTYVATDTRIDSIVAGCILAIAWNPVLDGSSIDRRRLLWLWLPFGTVAVLTSLVIREPAFEQTMRYTLQSFGLAPFFVAAVVWHDRPPFRWLNNRVARYLGTLTYSMYLMHTTLIWAVDNWTHWHGLVKAFVELCVLVALASAIYHYVEQPCARARRRLATYLRGG